MSGDDALSRLEAFRGDLLKRDPIEIARKHIIFGDCAVLSKEMHFSLLNSVAKQFGVHPHDIIVVGSAKLGFSIAPTKRYKLFGDNSDIDVAIISQPLFDLVWKAVYQYSRYGGYWEGKGVFKKYLFRGWIRPDKLPGDHKFDFAREWWDFFNELSVSRDISDFVIRGAIYKDWNFLEHYQRIAVDGCVDELQEGEQSGEN